jgi:hypothetical protein
MNTEGILESLKEMHSEIDRIIAWSEMNEGVRLTLTKLSNILEVAQGQVLGKVNDHLADAMTGRIGTSKDGCI